jgi:thiamine-monophosphate kinase
MTRPSETDLIARYFAPLAGEGGLQLKDDAARLTPAPGHDVVLTADALVAGVHFFPDDPPGSIARKALGVNVSDLAAKGAEPRGFLIALALPADWTPAWLEAFAQGLGEAARDFGCPLLGGDTVRAGGALTLAITAAGEVPHGRMVHRAGAEPGDVVCVSGTIGDAALGLALRLARQGGPPAPWAAALPPDEEGHLLDRYLHPRPRVRLAPLLRAHASAAMDVSDGLAGDLAKLLRASAATAIIDTESVPLSGAARAALAADPSLIDRILTGGDDYEVLCTVPEAQLEAFQDHARAAGIAAVPIGQVVEGGGLPAFVTAGTERRYEGGSFSHF